jgi:effector-binding domain-containing protein
MGCKGMALASIAPSLCAGIGRTRAADEATGAGIEALVRPPTLFAGIRRPIKSREELAPRIESLRKTCGEKIAGPLTHIFRFDTPVDGYDSEIGFPVTASVDSGEIKTHTLRQMHFYSALHRGPEEGMSETRRKLYDYMNATGLSPELELVEVFHHRDRERPESSRTEIMASFLAWPEVYREQLTRVLGGEAASLIWQGGESITPHTLVDPRAEWVASSIARLKERSDVDQQFDILSRVALVRPQEDLQRYRELYERTGDIIAVLRTQAEELKKKSGKSYPDAARFDGKVLHMSKVPYDAEAYAAAKSHTERRKAYCFCNLVREARDPRIDPIFCYRAAGWSRQFVEPILGVEFKRCIITHSILKGDDFCAWDYHLEANDSA